MKVNSKVVRSARKLQRLGFPKQEVKSMMRKAYRKSGFLSVERGDFEDRLSRYTLEETDYGTEATFSFIPRRWGSLTTLVGDALHDEWVHRVLYRGTF